MVAIRQHKAGKSFKGLGLYLRHDKDSSESAERVVLMETRNIRNGVDPVRHMQWTALHQAEIKAQAGGSKAGKKAVKIVGHDVLSWSQEEDPSDAEMLEAVDSYIEDQGLEGHEMLLIGHNDTEHKHMHLMFNLIHPETGIRDQRKYSKEKAQDWALDYERERGAILCKQREENAALREAEKQRRQQCYDNKEDPGKARFTRYEDHQNYWDRDAYNIEAEQAVIDAAIEAAKEQEERQAEEDKNARALKRQQEQLAEGLGQKLANLQSRHHDALRAFDLEMDEESQPKIEEIYNQYSHSIVSNRAAIAALEEKLNQQGLAGMLYRARHGEAAREQLDNAQKSLDSALQTQQQALDTINNQAEARRQKLKEDQALERARLEKENAAILAQHEEPKPQPQQGRDKQQTDAKEEFTRQAANQNEQTQQQQQPEQQPQPPPAANQNEQQTQAPPQQDSGQKLER